jgi:hypothetical protein
MDREPSVITVESRMFAAFPLLEDEDNLAREIQSKVLVFYYRSVKLDFAKKNKMK